MQKINEKSDENSNKPSRSREGTQTSVAFSFVAILESSCRGKQIQIPPFTEMRRWKEYHALDLKAFAHYVMKAHTAKKKLATSRSDFIHDDARNGIQSFAGERETTSQS